jgi:thiamine biosynthesis lipoprotein
MNRERNRTRTPPSWGPVASRWLAGALALGTIFLSYCALPGPSARSETTAAPASGLLRAVAYPFPTMGTMARVLLVPADSASGVPDARIVRATFLRVDSLMTNWTQTSEVARINRDLDLATGAEAIDPEVVTVLAFALRVWKASDGAQDITVEPLVRAWGFLGGKPHKPTQGAIDSAFVHVGSKHLAFDAAQRTLRSNAKGVRIDLGGIAKGYAVAAAADSLRARGVQNALVDVSGNMAALGHPPDAAAWRVGIRNPHDRTKFFARLLLRDQAISTSATYEQFVAVDGRTYGHIMDPRTGRPAEGLLSVTVVAASALETDAWDTGLFVLGPVAGRRIAQEHPELHAVFVAPGTGGIDTVWVENALHDRFSLEPGEDAHFRVEFF